MALFRSHDAVALLSPPLSFPKRRPKKSRTKGTGVAISASLPIRAVGAAQFLLPICKTFFSSSAHLQLIHQSCSKLADVNNTNSLNIKTSKLALATITNPFSTNSSCLTLSGYPRRLCKAALGSGYFTKGISRLNVSKLCSLCSIIFEPARASEQVRSSEWAKELPERSLFNLQLYVDALLRKPNSVL